MNVVYIACDIMLVIKCAGNGRKQGKKGKKNFPRFADGQPSANLGNLAQRTPGLPMAEAIGKLTISLPMATAIGKKNREMIFLKQKKNKPTAVAIGKHNCLPMAT